MCGSLYAGSKVKRTINSLHSLDNVVCQKCSHVLSKVLLTGGLLCTEYMHVTNLLLILVSASYLL